MLISLTNIPGHSPLALRIEDILVVRKEGIITTVSTKIPGPPGIANWEVAETVEEIVNMINYNLPKKPPN